MTDEQLEAQLSEITHSLLDKLIVELFHQEGMSGQVQTILPNGIGINVQLRYWDACPEDDEYGPDEDDYLPED